MKKLLIFLLILIGVAILATTLLVQNVDNYIADVIRTEGTSALRTKVDVEKVETSFTEGTITVSGLSIANPDGYQNPIAISIDTFSAAVDYENQTIDNITIDNPSINTELVGTRSNFQELMDGIPDSEGEAEQANSDYELTINRLILSNATVNLLSDKLGKASFEMDDFVLHNLNGTSEQLSDTISSALISHILDQVKGFVTRQALTLARDKLESKAKQLIDEKITDKLNVEKIDKQGLKSLKFKLN